VKPLISIKDEGTELLNYDPMSSVKRGQAKDPDYALAAYRIAITLWLEEAVPILRGAGATDGEVSHISTIVKFSPVYPAISEDHAALKGMLAERLLRLDPIIRRIEGE
jgi:hypothetical protein